MAASGLQSDQLFLGLTRPTMILGVHYIIFMLNFMGSVLLFVNLQENKFPITFMIFITTHLLSYLVCLKEPRMIEMAMVRYGKCNKCRNRFYHKNTNTYDVR